MNQIHSYAIGRGVMENNPSRPAGVEYHPEYLKAPITIWEYSRIGRDASGCSLSYAECLTRVRDRPSFRRMFRQANAEWFLPFVERLAAGEDVTIEEINSKHVELFGKPLQSELIST